jgi:catechol 2,3-dioxygenase-like lactoylglutathione lyase family enzyme
MLKAISMAVPAALLAAALAPVALVDAQTGSPAAGKAAVIGTGSFTSFVENMDRSLAFYHDAFGMEVPPMPAAGERPYNRTNPQLFAMFDIDGAKERHQSARIPGSRITVEIMEIQQVPHQTIPLRIQDPGNAAIVFVVRDVEASLAKAVGAKAVVATPGGKPISLADGTRVVLIRDLDGRYIELRQSANAPANATGDVFDMRLSITVKNMDETLKAYRDVLGFKVEGETPFVADAGWRSLTGLAKAQMRVSRVQAPGSQLWIEFVEYKGVDRKPLSMKIQDRGAARLQVRVQDADAMVALVKTGGFKIHSVDNIAQPIPPNLKGALVADPNNFFLTPFAPCNGCAPTVGGVPLRATKDGH